MKEKIILCGKHGRPSTKLAWSSTSSNSILVHKRELRNKPKYYRMFNNQEALKNDIESETKRLYQERQNDLTLENSVVIRWGSRENLAINNNSIVYNKCNALDNSNNKYQSRLIFKEKNVNTPLNITRDNYNVATYPIIARPYNHSKGSNFITLNTEDQFLDHYNTNSNTWYYSSFINKIREFRVHAAHGKCLVLMEKHNPNNGNIAWNRAQNDSEPFTRITQEQMDSENLKEVIIQGLAAIKALDLDFGGVDVMLDIHGNVYVLEVNTAPTLNSSSYVAERWGMYWDWLFNSETRREHWDYTQFQKASSLVWKIFQLKDEPISNNF